VARVLIVDVRESWRGRPQRRRRLGPDGRIGEGIRLYAGERSAEAIDRVLMHHWGSPVSPAGDDAAPWALLQRDRPADDVEREALLLAARAVRVPYAISVGAVGEVGLVIRAWPATLTMQHAAGQNATSYGVGIMGRWDRRAVDDAQRKRSTLDAIAAAGAVALELAAAECGVAVPMLHTHSQSAPKPDDPGEWIVRHVVGPAVERRIVVVDPDWYTGKGRPWPRWWR